MNSEELELSLRTEFENYLKTTLARFRQEISDIRVNFEAEFDKHRAHIEASLGDMESRFDSNFQFDRAFTESVLEHLRLARDEGAELAATAFGEAEKLRKASASASYDQLRDAIVDISRQQTQTAILQSLVAHSARFAPRGAFFIVKNDYFIGWRVFGAPGVDEASVREIFFPTADATVISAAADSVSTQRAEFGKYSGDETFLEPLGFGRPRNVVAIPLTARGRAVAVMYIDGGSDDAAIDIEAIESLVRVAGLTVELQASYAPRSHQSVPPQSAPSHQEPAAETGAKATEVEASEFESAESFSGVGSAIEASAEPTVTESEEAVEYQEYTGDVSVEEVPAQEVEVERSYEPEVETGTGVNNGSEVREEVSYFEPIGESYESNDNGAAGLELSSGQSFDVEPVAEREPEPAVAMEEAYAPREVAPVNGNGFTAVVEPPVEVATAEPVRNRPSGRKIDLPIEVSEDERRFHNEAYSFARLLISEIKLYNQQRVDEGRNSGDLYDRLREAIDRSREMYEKRVNPQVAARFDYFDYMLINNLADGNAAKLGANYPGAAV